MTFKIDSEHIFFDRFKFSDKEKQAQADYIISKALDEIGVEFSIRNEVITISEESIDCIMAVNKLIETLKYEFFIFLLPVVTEERQLSSVSASDKAEKYIRQNYLYEDMTVTQICEEVGVNRGALDAEFVKRYNMTISEYIRTMRVDSAKKLLKEGVRMDECASLVGFGSVKTMQRAFKAVCNRTPGEYRTGQLDSEEKE